jgi:hypothetical protein
VRISASEFEQSFDQMWARLDEDGNGEVDLKEFSSIFTDDPDLLAGLSITAKWFTVSPAVAKPSA